MRSRLRVAVWVVGILALCALTPTAQAQRRLLLSTTPVIVPGGVRTSVAIVASVPAPVAVAFGAQTTVRVPDGSDALVASYSQVAESRSEYGAPGIGKIPYLGRTARNVGYGRSTVHVSVRARTRIIDLREEEYRQTGYRSP